MNLIFRKQKWGIFVFDIAKKRGLADPKRLVTTGKDLAQQRHHGMARHISLSRESLIR